MAKSRELHLKRERRMSTFNARSASPCSHLSRPCRSITKTNILRRTGLKLKKSMKKMKKMDKLRTMKNTRKTPTRKDSTNKTKQRSRKSKIMERRKRNRLNDSLSFIVKAHFEIIQLYLTPCFYHRNARIFTSRPPCIALARSEDMHQSSSITYMNHIIQRAQILQIHDLASFKTSQHHFYFISLSFEPSSEPLSFPLSLSLYLASCSLRT